MIAPMMNACAAMNCVTVSDFRSQALLVFEVLENAWFFKTSTGLNPDNTTEG